MSAQQVRDRGAATGARQAGRPSPDVPSGDPGGRIAGLDGLRAFAVLAVLVYHFLPGAMPGGFVGVDVFFVVSGFLITSLLLREIRRSGRVDLVDFWRRRFRRLMPAVFLVLVVAFPLAWLVDRDLTVDAGRQILGALTFTTNWLEIIAGTSYFDQTAPHLMKNLWSLAIEEQFYWLWPILLVVLVRLTGGMRTLARTASGARAALAAAAQRRTLVALVVAVASMVLMAVLITPGQDATRVYYGTDTHLFGLALGVGLAFVRSAPGGGALGAEAWRRWAPLVGLVALAGIVALSLGLDEGSVWTYRVGLQGANLLTLVLLAAVVTPALGGSARTSAGEDVGDRGGAAAGATAVGSARTNILARGLEAAPLRYVGERSYGIYLWHWPVLVVLLQAFPTAEGTGARWAVLAACLALTLAIAEASFRWFETPVRRLGVRTCARALWTRARDGVGAAKGIAIALLSGALALTLSTLAVVVTAPAESETAAVIAAKEAEIEAARRAEIAKVANLGDRSMPAGEDITVFGDSIVVTAKDGLTATFPGIDINAKSIRRWGDGLTALHADMDAERVRRAVVVDYGTNAGIEDEAEVREFLDTLGPERMVVVVNLASTSPWIPEVNAQLERIVEDYPNATIADWHGAIGARPELLQSDRIHPDLTGAYLYADVVREAFAELSERFTGEAVDLPPGPVWPEDTHETDEPTDSATGGKSAAPSDRKAGTTNDG